MSAKMNEIESKGINEIMSWFLKKINKIHKLIGKLTQRKNKKTKFIKIRDERGHVRKDNTDIQTIIRGYSENLYTNKFIKCRRHG
jgi:hypothetical protein